MQIGKKIRELRESKRMTLTELAEKSGVQIATLSRMEHLKMTGTLESHINIAQALGVDITQIYQNISKEDTQAESIEEESSIESFTYNEKASYEILASNILSKKMMPIVLRIERGGRTNVEQNKPGSEKFIFVLEGQITAYISEDSYILSANNTLYFDGSSKHYFENKGKNTAKMISIVTPVAL